MSRLKTGGHYRKQPVDIQVPTLAIETDIDLPMFDDSKICLPDDLLTDHPDSVQPLSLDDIRISQAEDL